MTLTNKVPEKDVHDLFSRVAPNYDKMNDLISLGTQRLWRKKLFKKLQVKPGDFCLDLCCGTGDLTIALAKQVGPSGNVVGLDFNEDMLRLAYDKVLTAGAEKEIQLRQADAMNLPYEDSSFDIVTIGLYAVFVSDGSEEAAGFVGEFGDAVCVEFMHEVFAVGAHGVGADAEGGGYLGSVGTVDEHGEYLQLALGEAVVAGGRGAECGAEVFAVFGECADGPVEFVDGVAFAHGISYAVFPEPGEDPWRGVHGVHQNAGVALVP